MLWKKIAAVWVLGCGIGLLSAFAAEQERDDQKLPANKAAAQKPQPKKTGFFNQIGGFLGIASEDEKKPEPPKSPTPAHKTPARPSLHDKTEARAGSVLDSAPRAEKPATTTPSTAQNLKTRATTYPKADATDARTGPLTDADRESLYQRMNALRQSPFGDSAKKEAGKPTAAKTASTNKPTATPTVAPTTASTPKTQPTSEYVPYVGRERSDTLDRPLGTPIASRPVKTEPAPIEPKPIAPAITKVADTKSAEPKEVKQEEIKPVAKNAIRPDSRGLLVTRQSPQLSSETVGPRKIIVGKASAFEVMIQNSGEVAAEELTVFVELPAWADVAEAEGSTGTTQMAALTDARQVHWKIGSLSAKSRERLVLKITPRENRAFDLGVRWDFRQNTSQASIEVQEPKLAVRMEGPREVQYGRKEVYRIKVSNTGNGDAENVAIKLQPIGAGENVTVPHDFGAIAPGEEKSIDIEIVARQAGVFTMKVDAQCDGGARAQMAEQVTVRRAGLQLDAEGPKLQYADTAGTFRIRATNPGTATAKQIALSATLPSGAKFVSATDGGEYHAASNQVRWKIDSLAVTAQKMVELKCTFAQGGENRVEINGTADDDLRTAASVATRVETMAELALDVVNPPRPVSLGDQAVYELKIVNRGTKAAENIEIVAFFSQGIEPISVKGAAGQLGAGQVTFSPISSLAAGKELRISINAQAQQPGSHLFRVELNCRAASTRLVREETTLFYAADGNAPPAEQKQAAAAMTPIPIQVVPAPVRIAERQSPPADPLPSVLPSPVNEPASLPPHHNAVPIGPR